MFISLCFASVYILHHASMLAIAIHRSCLLARLQSAYFFSASASPSNPCLCLAFCWVSSPLTANDTVWQCLFHFCWLCYELKTVIYTVSHKTVQSCFCQNFFKFPPLLIIFGRKMAKRLKLCKVHSFYTSTNSCHHICVLNEDVSIVTQCWKLLAAINFLVT